jgi:glycosyltransferase involved in cell wall biosynthesis
MKTLRRGKWQPWPIKSRRQLRSSTGGSPVTLRAAGKSSRILIVSQVTVDGVAVCIRDLVQAAVSEGYQVTVACPPAGDLPVWVQERGAVWERMEMRRSPHASDILAMVRLRRLAQTHDLVHLHSSKAGAVGRLAVAGLGPRRPPVVFTPHGWSWLVGGWLSPVYRKVERIMLPLATVIIAVSDEERANGQAVLGRRARRMVVNPNGVDLSRFSPLGPVADRSDAPLVVCVGRLCHARAPDVAVSALALMRTPSVRLRLVGDGEDRAVTEKLVHDLGLDERVEFSGFRTNPALDLRAADVVMIPSRYDGMALVLLEAMACGATVVATRVPGTSALGGAGLLVPVEDAKSLAEAVDALLADPRRRQLLGTAARERVAKYYSLQRSLQRILSLWQDLGAQPDPDLQANRIPALDAMIEETS